MLWHDGKRVAEYVSLKKAPMQPLTPHTSIADYYYGVLSNLSAASKLDLISQLSQSLKQDLQQEPPSLKSLFGAYQGEETAEEIIEAIQNSRVSNRDIESL